MVLWANPEVSSVGYALEQARMSNEPRTSNATSFSKLKRTLTLPLPRRKHSGSRFLTLDGTRQNWKNGRKTENENIPRKRIERNASKNGGKTKNDAESSKFDVDEHAKISMNSISEESETNLSSRLSPNLDQDRPETSSESGKNQRKRPFRRWPADAWAKVLDVRKLKLLGGSKKNGNATDVVKTLTLNRNRDDTLGICIKEIERSVTPENKSNSDVRQSSVIVSRLIPGGIAEKLGSVRRGDEIVSVNNRDVSQMTIKEVAALMDYHKQLVLTVRSNCNNSNNIPEYEDTDKKNMTVNDTFESTSHGSYIDVNSAVFSRGKNSANPSSNKPSFREQTIPSIYDNNFPSLLAPILHDLPESHTGKEKQSVETEYNEAFQILLDAINSFESPVRSSHSRGSAAEIISESDLSNGFLDLRSSNDPSPVPSSLTNDSPNSSNPTNTSGFSSTPHFPSLSELPFLDEPEHRVFQSEVSISEEIQVDGWSQLCSSYKRSHSFSSYPSENIIHKDSPPVHTPSSSRDEKFLFVGYSERNPSLHGNSSDDKLSQTASNQKLYPPSICSRSESMQNESDDHRSIHGNITVRQCKQWSGRTKEAPQDHGDNTDRIEAENSAGSAVSTLANASDKLERQPQTLSNPDEKSARSMFKIDPLSNAESISQSEPSTSHTASNSLTAKAFWSKVASPPSLRKSKFTRTITKMAKKKSGSSAEWDSVDSTQDIKSEPSVVERYNLELGDVQKHRLSSHFIPRNGQNNPSLKPLDTADFKKYKPSFSNSTKYSFSSSQNPIKGSLLITLYGARDLKKVVSEIYCICQVDDDLKHRIRTSMRTCNGSVAWNECYEAKLEEANDLYLKMYAWESAGLHKELAKAKLPISELLCDQLGVSLKLAVKLEPRGTLYIKLSLEDPSKLEGPRVFGADLQSILDREQSGLPIPLLVHNCIHEVELRGMGIVGIYRLCGSAIAKRELRGKYENDSTSVSVCQDEIPDVNVITGILKDFLRELPQPLLPPELLEAVTQSMGDYTGSNDEVNPSSPFDPSPAVGLSDSEEKKFSGHSSVILNLIEVEKKVSLPPAEKATLYALLNHLKRVASNSERNKMTCQNLAVCFGPVLLGSVNTPPAKGLDLNAAIGFKQHIQVLNFMVSNWPDEPVQLASLEKSPTVQERTAEQPVEGRNARTGKRGSTVSLTRRISRLIPFADGSDDTDCEIMDMDSTVFGGANIVLRHSQRSGSLTDILESNVDAVEEEDDFGEEG